MNNKKNWNFVVGIEIEKLLWLSLCYKFIKFVCSIFHSGFGALPVIIILKTSRGVVGNMGRSMIIIFWAQNSIPLMIISTGSSALPFKTLFMASLVKASFLVIEEGIQIVLLIPLRGMINRALKKFVVKQNFLIFRISPFPPSFFLNSFLVML